MKALVYDGPGKIEYRDHPMPTLQADTDIIMKISESTICGTDLHIIKGGVPTVRPGTVLGHEATGVVTEMCVADTARHAAHYGLPTIIVSDACLSRSTLAHQLALDDFDQNYGWVMTTREVTSKLCAD